MTLDGVSLIYSSLNGVLFQNMFVGVYSDLTLSLRSAAIFVLICFIARLIRSFFVLKYMFKHQDLKMCGRKIN